MSDNTNATKHGDVYPQGEVSPCWAYGFRPFFLILPWYIALVTILWGFSFSGIVPLPPFSEPLLWHIYELLYGVGFAGIAAFLFTGVPELFPGTIPLVGRKLQYLMALWIAGRISFWAMGILGIYPALITNIAFSLAIITWCFKPVVLDPLQRHASLAYTVLLITLIQGAIFLSIDGLIPFNPYAWLYLALGCFIVLILLALRRVQTEAINEDMKARGIEDLFIARAFRYNLAIFCILLFTLFELLGIRSTAGWLAFASTCAVLGILNDFKLRFEPILHLPYVLIFAAILIFIALGYALLGTSYLFGIPYLSHARHILTIGAFGGAFLAVMIVVSFVHTGRKVSFDLPIALSLIALFAALVTRLFAGISEGAWIYSVSALLFAASFLIYYYRFKDYLSNPRPDGIPG